MTLIQLILREIQHRKLSFLLGVAAVSIAVGTLIAAQASLQIDSIETRLQLDARREALQEALASKQAAVTQAGAELEDAMRKHMLGLGFNVLILPEDQDLSELHLSGGLSATMPESHVEKLARSNIVTVNHLLPSVTRRITWPEEQRDIILVGTRGEVPIMHRGLKKPMLEAVAPGKIVVGYDVHKHMGLAEGDTVTLMGREFTVSTLHPQRGSEEDVTVWIDLEQAQEMLGLENLIHAILALECECAGDRISVIREEIAGVLPGTQVVERYSAALARAEARAKAKASAEEALAAEEAAGSQLLEKERSSRIQQMNQRAELAGIIVVIAVAASMALIALLAFVNARQRQAEVGILRAIGLTGRQVLAAFLGKAFLIGLIGGLLGCAAGVLISGAIPGVTSEIRDAVFRMPAMTLTLWLTPVIAICLSAVASWVPALLAVRQDPALILQGD